MKTQSAMNEVRLKAMFESNFERLRMEKGHALSPEAKWGAWLQVKYYWKKLGWLAESVTDTEVRLTLPGQKTPKGRLFCIEGVVDIVRKKEQVMMYDLKTHPIESILADISFYRDQLNVYAHIWQKVRGERLDGMAIISTALPEPLKRALNRHSSSEVQEAFEAWEPIISIPLKKQDLTKTLRSFGETVDKIHDRCFQPASLQRLSEINPTDGRRFATRVCGNCDARYSCVSHQKYRLSTRGQNDSLNVEDFPVRDDD